MKAVFKKHQKLLINASAHGDLFVSIVSPTIYPSEVQGLKAYRLDEIFITLTLTNQRDIDETIKLLTEIKDVLPKKHNSYLMEAPEEITIAPQPTHRSVEESVPELQLPLIYPQPHSPVPETDQQSSI